MLYLQEYKLNFLRTYSFLFCFNDLASLFRVNKTTETHKARSIRMARKPHIVCEACREGKARKAMERLRGKYVWNVSYVAHESTQDTQSTRVQNAHRAQKFLRHGI